MTKLVGRYALLLLLSASIQAVAVPAEAVSTAVLTSGVRANWGYAALGEDIGASRIVVSDTSSPPRLYFGNSPEYGPNRYWVALQYSPATSGYEEIFVSADVGPIVRMALADVIGDSGKEIIVALSNGQVFLYDELTFTLLDIVQTVPGDVLGMLACDHDGDGMNEILITTTNTLSVFDGSGTMQWQLSGPGGVDLIAAQMDDDPALEIATTSGHVVDAATHGIQWKYGAGFGLALEAADVDNDGKAELLTIQSLFVIFAYDVDLRLPKWSYNSAEDFTSFIVANVDADAAPELLLGERQWGKLVALDSATRTIDWTITVPEYSVDSLAYADLDDDGVMELAFGSNGANTAQDFFYVASAATRQIEWKSYDLGEFVGPALGDIDGDALPELVVAAGPTDATYAGRILVFDGTTRALRLVSPPILSDYPSELRLRNIDGDSALELLIAGWQYITIYDFNPATNTFSIAWRTTTSIGWTFGSGFAAADIADVDANGSNDVYGGAAISTGGTISHSLLVYDYATANEQWRSPPLGTSNTDPFGGAAILAGGAGSPDFLGMPQNGSIYVFDGMTKQLLAEIAGPFTAFRDRGTSAVPRSFFTARPDGTLLRYDKSGGAYTAAASEALGLGSISSISELPAGDVAVAANGNLSFLGQPFQGVQWTSAPYWIAQKSRTVQDSDGSLFASGFFGVFAFAQSPSVSAIAPGSGPASGGTAVTISGARFPADAAVRFDGSFAESPVVLNATTIDADAPPLQPGTLNDVIVVRPQDSSTGVLHRAFFADFLDVTQAHPFHDFVETIFRYEVTAGCGGGSYCPDAPVLRSQMAVFLLRALHGRTFVPPPATGIFTDVPPGSFAADYIERLYQEGIAAGCGVNPPLYCPDAAVQRAQMAVFLLRAKHGDGYVPPPAIGIFADVPPGSFAANFIEQLYREGITGGCAIDPLRFCPGEPVLRGQMSVFLTVTFGLQ